MIIVMAIGGIGYQPVLNLVTTPHYGSKKYEVLSIFCRKGHYLEVLYIIIDPQSSSLRLSLH